MPAKTANGSELMPETVELASAANFASVATVQSDGLIQNQTIWVGVENGVLILNTEIHRAKYLSVNGDPRVTVLIRDEQDPYRYAEVRGEVAETIIGDRARSQIDELARKYTGNDDPPEDIRSERVILRIVPARQTYIHQKAGVAD
jgi:PPOX class probable F420-dependent enzyme